MEIQGDIPNKYKTLNQCCFNANKASWTVGQHWTSIGSTSCVCLVGPIAMIASGIYKYTLSITWFNFKYWT